MDPRRLTCHGFPPPLIRGRPTLRMDDDANEVHGDLPKWNGCSGRS